MDREVLEQLPQLQPVLKELAAASEGDGKSPSLADRMWAVVGGNPLSYTYFMSQSKCWKRPKDSTIADIAEDFIDSVLWKAESKVASASFRSPFLVRAFVRLETKPGLSHGQMVLSGWKEGITDDVLRLLPYFDCDYEDRVVPASPAIALVIKHGRLGTADDGKPTFRPASAKEVREALGWPDLRKRAQPAASLPELK
jgi:hypothetical protein